jgi:hypothetical protein
MSQVSVLIPVFDGAAVIGQAVENILGQTRPPTEIVIADDGSRDGLAARVEALRLRCEASGVTLCYVGFPENRGRGAARNLALDAATGDLIAWFDVDDLWSPAKLAVQFECFERLRFDHPARRLLLTCAYHRYDAAAGSAPQVISPPPIVGIDDIVSLHLRRHIQLQTVFGPRDTFLQHRFDEELNRVEDFDFALRFAAAGGKFANCPTQGPPLIHYFRSGANKSEEAAACNKRVLGKRRAIFQANHIDPEAFLIEKLGSLRAGAPPMDGTLPALAPGKILPRWQDDAPPEQFDMVLLPDGSLRIEGAHEGEGEYVAEGDDRAEIDRGAFSAVIVIPQSQFVNWFMAGSRSLQLRANSGSSIVSERLRIVRTRSGLISVAR